MTKYNTNISESASEIMDIPDDLQGLVKEVNGLTEVGGQAKPEPKEDANVARRKNRKPKETIGKTVPVPEGDSLWNAFVNGCNEESDIDKVVGRDGNAGWCLIDKEIIGACRSCPVNGHGITDMVNAILRQFILHYRPQLLRYKKHKDSLI